MITTQTWKTVVIVGSGIVESLIHYLLVSSDQHATTEWELKMLLPGNSKKVDGELVKADVHVSRRLKEPRMIQMTYDAMIQKARSRRLLGSTSGVYDDLMSLKKLRNRVHLQAIDEPTDTDWNAFRATDLQTIYRVVHGIFTGSIFRLTSEEVCCFGYLRRLEEE